jgi:aminoglycoside phosphotransferase family enzyme/predicted kinase
MDALISALLRPEAHEPPELAIELVETHISWVLLVGDYAYKIKKPVNLGFVDFSSPMRRAWFCAEELRLNRRLAPNLYLAVVPIYGPIATASFHGEGPVIEMALKMRRFPQAALLPAAIERGEVSPAAFDGLAERLAAFHARAAVADASEAWGSPLKVQSPAIANLDVLEQQRVEPDTVAALRHWTMAEASRLEPRFRRRKAEGRVRECHGDLHLGNMVFVGSRIEAFDCLEFSPELRWIDVISDLAFAVMDLQQRGLARPADRLLGQWLERSGDYPGLELWSWYRVYRALVRAKVTVLRLGQADLPRQEAEELRAALGGYLAWALALTQPQRPALVITHGISGSGKSHWARRLARGPGWLHLRSDVERKRRFGLWGDLQNLGDADPLLESGDLYGPAVSQWLYRERLTDCAAAALAAGLNVVVDATFLKREQRHWFAALAERGRARFAVLECVSPPQEARRRVEERRAVGVDPSDADDAVINRQLEVLEPIGEEERLGIPMVCQGTMAGVRAMERWLASRS